MRVAGKTYQTLWLEEDQEGRVFTLDQNALPFAFRIRSLESSREVAEAIADMTVRGAPLIGACGAAGIYLAVYHYKGSEEDLFPFLEREAEMLKQVRPTAVNLAWAVDHALAALSRKAKQQELIQQSRQFLLELLESEKEACRKIGEYGFELIRDLYEKEKRPVQILTHCNAGWLACIDYGTATAPIYKAHDEGIPVHVWVEETRPRQQGAMLTCWELQQHGVPCTLIADNAGGHLMQKGKVDFVMVGSDRTTATGDVANKIGTYLKALAAEDNEVSFYVALPSSSIDFALKDGLQEIPIEERAAEEVTHIRGLTEGEIREVQVCPDDTQALNPAFDVTPGQLVTGLITERGICMASEEGIRNLFPDK